MAADENLNVIENLNNLNEKKNFLCGVVEGFYGRPWTPEQRKDLFVKQQKWGMNCYLYAPKDDFKHRACWRELYTVEEAEHLTALISEAHHYNITFYYAISPGLDITYSSQKEVSTLKRKLEQVQQLGCNAFAILFDDIDPEMSGADKEMFQSFAHAQVSVANDVFTHLRHPKFMFCPTQYCSTRAVPSVQTSEYLNTLGSKLEPKIDIMWTGPKVISKVLSVDHIREVTEVLKRPPVVWDNLHANDYDQARIFLGPYCGRSPDLIKLLHGVVINPNCEYGPNFIAIHTLAQWSKSSSESSCDNNDAVSADIRLETEGYDSNDDCPTGLSPSTYHPRRALRLALTEWLEEFGRPVNAYGRIQQPQIQTQIPILPSVNTCMSLTSTTIAVQPLIPQPNINLVEPPSQDGLFTSPVVMNSLVSENKIVLEDVVPEDTDSTTSQGTTSSKMELMDCNPSPANSPPHDDDTMLIENKVEPTADPVDQMEDLKQPEDSKTKLISEDRDLSVDDLQLLADLFYLPYEHGKQGLHFMSEFNWLKVNSHLVRDHDNNSSEPLKPEVQEWFTRAEKFSEMNNTVKNLYDKLTLIKNRALLYDLYPYMWDMRGVISLLNSYVKWLALGQVSAMVANYVHGNFTWLSKGWREAFMSGDQEPWVFRGGLTAELQRLIPVNASSDLFLYKSPEVPVPSSFLIRPYIPEDRDRLYEIALRTADDGQDGTATYSAHPDLVGDLTIGCFIQRSSGAVCMVLEGDSSELVGYCLASNAANYAGKQSLFLSQLSEKYPKVVREEGVLLTPCEELLAKLNEDSGNAAENIQTSFPALITLCVLPIMSDFSISKRLLTCVLASLRAQGTFGCHSRVNVTEKNTYDLYVRLGFMELTTEGSIIYMGRSL